MNRTPETQTLRIDLAVNLVMMLGMGAFFFCFPCLFAPWPPSHIIDAVTLVAVGQAAGLAAAVWSKSRGARPGPIGRRILEGVYGSFLATFMLILLGHTVTVLFLEGPADTLGGLAATSAPQTDLILIRLLPFAPALAAIAGAVIVWRYDRRRVPSARQEA